MKRKLLFILLSGACAVSSSAQNAALDTVWEYVPAPGQFVHELPLYEPEDDAAAMAGKCLVSLQDGVPVSLGGYGGYLTVGFDHPVLNLPGQKDFAVWGNAFDGSAEPGIVQVSCDTNGDGLPNDEWYELAGSESANPATLHGYEISYTRPSGTEAGVPWTDNQGRSGTIEYMGGDKGPHSHPHYPEWISGNTLTFKGTCLPDNGKWDKEKKMWVMKPYASGYADNYPNSNTDGCSFDIGWATDANGQPVALESIDFIRIYTGVNQQIPSGGVGELSTEITGVEDLHPLAAGISANSLPERPTVFYSDGMLFTKHPGDGVMLIYDWKGALVRRIPTNGCSGSYPVDLPHGVYLVRCPEGLFKLGI